jgi:hypothetical protein
LASLRPHEFRGEAGEHGRLLWSLDYKRLDFEPLENKLLDRKLVVKWLVDERFGIGLGRMQP